MTIYYFSPDCKNPTGGMKQTYQHVESLCAEGIDAKVLHTSKGFTVPWFQREAPVAYLGETWGGTRGKLLSKLRRREYYSALPRHLKLGTPLWQKDKVWKKREFTKDDILVLPEYFGKDLLGVATGIKKVIFNQNTHYSFRGHSLQKDGEQSIYQDPDVLGALVVAEHNKDYLEYVFPDLTVHHVKDGIDTDLFKYSGKKKKQIAFMPRKLSDEVLQVINILKFRNTLKDWDLVLIDGMTELEVSEAMEDAAIFLSFATQEGLGLPSIEAGLRGCLVVGYPGYAGDEFFLPEYTYPIVQGDILNYVKTIERVMTRFEAEEAAVNKQTSEYAAFLHKQYCLDSQKKDLIKSWKEIAQL
jgi:hypothetical protein